VDTFIFVQLILFYCQVLNRRRRSILGIYLCLRSGTYNFRQTLNGRDTQPCNVAYLNIKLKNADFPKTINRV